MFAEVLEISARANSSVVVVCKDNYSTTKEIQFVGTFYYAIKSIITTHFKSLRVFTS